MRCVCDAIRGAEVNESLFRAVRDGWSKLRRMAGTEVPRCLSRVKLS